MIPQLAAMSSARDPAQLPDPSSIKQEAEDTPRSWDSGVALDSVTALQMAEFQAVVDSLVTTHRPGEPPPYPALETSGDLDTLLLANTGAMFPHLAHTYQPGPATLKFENITKAGCQSLPSNGTIQPKIIDKIEHRYISNQR